MNAITEPATNKEVEQALFKEAKNKYKNKKVKCLISGTYEIDFDRGVFEFRNNRLCLYSKNNTDGVWVFRDGKWRLQ